MSKTNFMRFINPGVVWTEEEIKEVKQVAKILLSGGFKKRQIAHLLDVSPSSIYNWIKKGEI